MDKIVAIIQARCGSTRFPDKVFADISGKPLIWHVVNRLKFSETITNIVLATTNNILDDKLYEWALENGVSVYRGDENNVLNRYAEATKSVNANIIIRITADDPFKDPQLIDTAVNVLISEKADFVCNNNPPSFPEGLDVEVFTKNAILIADRKADNLFEKEHVTQYFYRHASDFKIINLKNNNDISHYRWTVDTELDLTMTKKVYTSLYKGDNEIFYLKDILDFLELHPEVAEINANVARSSMYKK